MSAPTVAELRERLQAPRRPYDTYYGRRVMRFFSIYLTLIFIRWGTQPSSVTLLSLVVGVWGSYLLLYGQWVTGLLFVNFWYLLDHVDGELARYYKKSSASGLYFDTILNAIVPPLTFFSLGWSLGASDNSWTWVAAGSTAAYGSLMLLIIPYCEAMVLRQWSESTRPSEKKAVAPSEKKLANRLFNILHTAVTFPVFLPLITVAALFSLDLRIFLMAYAATVSTVWIVILSHHVATGKSDKAFQG